MPATPRGWLLDTNVISELRRAARWNRQVIAWADSVASSLCFVSIVTIAEIRFGIEGVGDMTFRAALEAWLDQGVRVWFGTRILPVDEQVLLTWRRLVTAGQKAKYTYSQPDSLIAATALAHGLVVVTRNVAAFERAGVPLLDPWTG